MPEEIDYQRIVKELLTSTTQKAVSSTPTAYYGHGAGGLFSTPGMSRPIFSAMALPRTGLASILPAIPTRDTNPLYAIITGVTPSVGENPNGVCDDPPYAGVTKLCTHSFVFGRFSRRTKVYDVDRVGKWTNRGEFGDFRLMGNPLAGQGNVPNPMLPSIQGQNWNSVAANEIAKALFELAVTWSRDFARVTYTGTPTNNTAGNGYMEFYGLETLVNTGYQDAITGIQCPAADSIVENFGGLEVRANANQLIRLLANIFRRLRHLSSTAGLDPVQWVMAMRFGLFYELTEVYPISYFTYRNSVAANIVGNTNFVNSADIERLRDDMRGDLYNYQGQFLLIDGQRIPVVLDDAIPETQSEGGAFTSDLYILPMSVLGGQPVSYWEYFDYDAPGGSMEFARSFVPGDTYYTSDNGRFLWHKKPPTNWCVELLAKTEPRLLLLVPYLAARLQNIVYVPLGHERNWDAGTPGNTPSFHYDGGQITYPAPSYYPPTR